MQRRWLQGVYNVQETMGSIMDHPFIFFCCYYWLFVDCCLLCHLDAHPDTICESLRSSTHCTFHSSIFRVQGVFRGVLCNVAGHGRSCCNLFFFSCPVILCGNVLGTHMYTLASPLFCWVAFCRHCSFVTLVVGFICNIGRLGYYSGVF